MNTTDFDLNTTILNTLKKQESRGTVISIIDGDSSINNLDRKRVDVKAPGIMYRDPVNEPMITGVKALDSLRPIDRGTTIDIIGDRQTGKTTIAVDSILNQKIENRKNPKNALYCIYCAIGQKRSSASTYCILLKRENPNTSIRNSFTTNKTVLGPLYGGLYCGVCGGKNFNCV